MQQDAELLNSIYQNAKMGEELTRTISKSVDSDQLKSDLQTQMSGYSQLNAKVQQKFAEEKLEPQEENGLSKASAYLGTKLNTLVNHSPSHVAEILIQGSTMGVIDMTQNINKFTSASQPVKDLAGEVITFENQNIERMKTYL